MPHVTIKLYPGRTEEKKKVLAQKIAEEVAEIAGCKESSVSVAIDEIQESEWMTKVYENDIVKNQDKLVIKPGYGHLSGE
jgi:4-oxalocrotonate tautomerase